MYEPAGPPPTTNTEQDSGIDILFDAANERLTSGCQTSRTLDIRVVTPWEKSEVHTLFN